jgi:DNA-binding GntR family transcriptional regulator
MQPGKGYDIKQEVRRQIIALASDMGPQSRGKLPSETSLADRFGVSRLTVRTVLAELAAEGMVRRKHGAGTFVVSSAAEENVVCFHSRVYFEKMIRQHGMHPYVEVDKITVIPADNMVCKRLCIGKGENVVRIRKLFFGDDQLVVYNIMALPARYAKKVDLDLYCLPRDAIWEMVERVAQRKGVTSLACEITQIGATNAARTPELLPYVEDTDAGAHPFIVMRTTFRDVMQEPLIFSTCYVNADIINFGAVLTPPPDEP